MKIDRLGEIEAGGIKRARRREGREGSFEESLRRNLVSAEAGEAESAARTTGGRLLKTAGPGLARQARSAAEGSSLTEVPVRHIGYTQSDEFKIHVEDGYTIKMKRENDINAGDCIYLEIKRDDGSYAAYRTPAREYLLADGGIDVRKLEEAAAAAEEAGGPDRAEEENTLVALLKDKWKSSKKLREFMEADKKLEKLLERVRKALEDEEEDTPERMEKLMEVKRYDKEAALEKALGRLFEDKEEQSEGREDGSESS